MEKMYILGEIGGWGTYAAEVQYFLDNNKGEPVEIVLSSPGGWVCEGVAIANLLKQHDGEVTTRAVSEVASISSVIFLAGTNRIVEKGAWLMIHKPWNMVAGDATQLRKSADVLDILQAAIQEMYNEVFLGSAEELTAVVDAETWMLGEEAVKLGFATRVSETVNAVASTVKHNLSMYNNVPAALKRETTPPPRNIDKKDKGQDIKTAENKNTQIQEDKTMEVGKATAKNVQEENPALYQAIASAGKAQEQNRVTALKGLATAAAAAPAAVQAAVNVAIDKLVTDPEATAENSASKIILAMSTAQAAVENTTGASARELAKAAADLDAGETEGEEEETAAAEAKNRVAGIATGLKQL